MVFEGPEAMRTVLHPGEPVSPRINTVAVDLAERVRVVVEPGDDLFETVHRELEERRVMGASFVLIDGTVAKLRLMTGGPGRAEVPMSFYGPHDLSAPLRIVAGAAGSGIDEDGRYFSHCHAVFHDRDGRFVGGHLLPGETIAGEDGIALDLFAFTGARFERRFDPETQFTIFHAEAA